MLFVRYKFWHIVHNNTTLSTHSSNLSLARIWNLLMTRQNGAVSNLCSTNCSGAPSVVWNPQHLINVSLYFTPNHSSEATLSQLQTQVMWQVNEKLITVLTTRTRFVQNSNCFQVFMCCVHQIFRFQERLQNHHKSLESFKSFKCNK